jgi:hypothetical protein
MKVTLRESQAEVYKLFCDKHPEIECFNEVNTSSWYGSAFDLLGTQVHLCDDCMYKLRNFLELEFNAKFQEHPI